MSKLYYEVIVEQKQDKSYTNNNGELVKFDLTHEIVGKFKSFEDVDGFVHTIMNCFEDVTVKINIKKEEQ